VAYAVICDCIGRFIAAGNIKLNFVQDVLSAEAHAIKQDLLLAPRVILTSDYMDVILVMKEVGQSSGVAATIFDDCYHLASEFPKIIFGHSFRESNCVAHELARVARGIADQVWLDDPPNFLLPVFLNDVTLLSNE
jgi:hypothetical protein